MTYFRGAGSEIGEGLSAFVQQFLGTQNTLRQQDEARAQQERENAFREQQATEQRRQFDANREAQATRDANDQEYRNWQRQTTGAQQGAKDRSDYFDTHIRPAYNAGMEMAVGNLKRYAPTLPDGSKNPQYDRAMYDLLQNQVKGLNARMKAVSDAAASGEGFYDAGRALLNYIGADDPRASPATPQTVPQGLPSPTPSTPAMLPSSGPPVPPQQGGGPAPVTSSGEGVQGLPAPSMPVPQPPTALPPATGPTAAQPSPEQQGPRLPTSPQPLPARVQDIPPSQLSTMDDDALLRQYGQGGVEYARAARAEYEAQVRAQREAVRKSQVDFWGKAAQTILDDKDRPATPEQMSAAATVMALINLPSLTGDQPDQFAAAVRALTPRALTAATWQDVLNTKDPAVILGALPMYRAQAPDVVKGFDDQALYNWLQADLDDKASTAFRNYAAGNKDNIDAGRTTTLLPLEVRSYDDKHDESVAGQAKTVADTAYVEAQTDGVVANTQNTRQDTENDALDGRVKAFDLGLKQLAGIASNPLPWQRMAASNPKLWFQMKQNLGLTDEGLANLYAQGQYKYGLGVKGDELANQLKASEIATDAARRGGILADTENTRVDTQETLTLLPYKTANLDAETADVHSRMRARDAELQPRLDLLNAQIRTEVAQGRNVDSLIRERDTLLPVKAGEGAARTASIWADVAKVQADIKNDRQRTAAYVKGVEGSYVVDMERVKSLGADTLLTRSKNPNDPLYNPVIANAKPNDPVTALGKKAGLFYTQANQALSAADKLQGQIKALTDQAKGVTGTVDLSRLSADDRKKLDAMVRTRDDLFHKAQGFRQQGDDVITEGMNTLSGGQGKPATVAPGLSAAQQWAADHPEVRGVQSDCAAVAGMYLNDLGLNIPTSNLSAGLEVNAKKAGWQPVSPKGGWQVGDLVVWTGAKYGLQKDGKGTGKHVGAVAGFDAQGNPMILDNPGLLADGTQGQTRVRPMSDQGSAVVYRSPQAGRLSAAPSQPARPTQAAPAAPKPTAGTGGDSYNGVALPPRPKVTGQGAPEGLTPVGTAAQHAGRIMTWSWMQAQQIETPGAANAWLDRTVKGLLPKGTEAQRKQLRNDLANSLGW